MKKPDFNKIGMTLAEADSLFATSARLKAVEKIVSDKKIRRALLCGLSGSSPAMLLAAMKQGKKPMLVVASDADNAGYFYNDLCQIAGPDKVAILPSGYKRHIKYGQVDPPSQILRTEALDAWTNLKSLRWVVTYPEALAEKVPSQKNISDSTLRIRQGEKMILPDLRRSLLDMGFCKVDYVYEPGQFAMRGSIVDIFSYSSELPARIDFFDDEIDSIRSFNVETQLSENKLNEVAVIPEKTGDTDGISFIEFTGEDVVTVVACNPADVTARITETAAEKASVNIELSGEGDKDAMHNVVDAETFAKEWNDLKILRVKSSGCEDSSDNDTEKHDIDLFKPQATVDFHCTPQNLYHKNFELISESFTKFLNDGYHILILSDSPYQSERLKSIFSDRGDNIVFTPVSLTIHEGFADNETKICYFTDHQIFDRFHKYNLKSDKARSGKLALSLKELQQIEPGDYIVHIDHGIGRFAGLIKSDVNGRPQELIKLVYQNDDIILVSIHALHKLSKYRGKEGVPPKISRLGSGAWNKLKQRTKTNMKDIARDLIKLYAARKNEKGFAFSPDSYLQHELEAGFIYEDTPDQVKATQAIKADMESLRPMDRLVCGDVGFGKTEIAIRAAFKAANDGKQTAVLVPTTVLAMQHYNTFKKRLQDMPVKVEFISRAKKPKEVKQILADLESGYIDIIIGTHKLIGKSVKFKDLGLLIVDEEQKFGVAVKEKLKQLKTNVDTLTMSATPIPRTLQFSLMGARDLSSLNTPPANRRPVATTVTSFNDDIIAEAINFEVSRNGQVFFVSNRIERLNQIKNQLERIVPGVRVIVAHGQMSPEMLEKAIIDFSNHDYDVLLSTTIVENGIDMPNVNTILIDNAQNFGLSELHQLRGRVGRSARKAFCYMLTPPQLPLSPVARRRLQAIESFSDLGSGIHIAMQDLDIRGAGNLLGAEQSGFIADLGYETYQKILRESVVELKTEEFGDTFTDVNAGKQEEFTADCTIESDMELRLPPDYVPSESERIALYQQLDNIDNIDDINQFREHLRDRFGSIPKVAEELIAVVPLRLSAQRLGIERLVLKDGKMRLYFVGDDNKAYYQSDAFGHVVAYLQKYPIRCEIKTPNGRRAIIVNKVDSVSEANNVLSEMMQCRL